MPRMGWHKVSTRMLQQNFALTPKGSIAQHHTILTAQYHNVPQVLWKCLENSFGKLPFDQVFGALGRTPATKSRDARDLKQHQQLWVCPDKAMSKGLEGLVF